MPGEARRREQYDRVSHALAALDDRRLRELVAGARRLGRGIGGDTALASVDDVPVFVKRIPLTDRERTPEHHRRTANLFGLPVCCHYGIGSPGFGAWREVEAHELTTGWVLDGTAGCFPLAYHWRVVAGGSSVLPEELRDVDRAVRYWHGDPGVRTRIEELAGASASVLMFLEYVPSTLDGWLTARMADGAGAYEAACAMTEKELHAAADLMAEKGFLHLDAHFENVLTDGSRLYLGDLGLAMCERFDLADDEVVFFERHREYDRSYLVAQLSGRLSRDADRDPLPARAARIVDRYRPVVSTVRPFYRRLQTETRWAEYPVDAERAAWAEVTPRP